MIGESKYDTLADLSLTHPDFVAKRTSRHLNPSISNWIVLRLRSVRNRIIR